MVLDPKAGKTISAAGQKSIIDYNVFEGMEVRGLPRYTLSRGEVVWSEGRNDAPRPGRGRFVPRPAFHPVNSRALDMEGAGRPARRGTQRRAHADRGVSRPPSSLRCPARPRPRRMFKQMAAIGAGILRGSLRSHLADEVVLGVEIRK